MVESLLDREKNRTERREFIRAYAAWVRRVPNRVWSSQQAELIDSLYQNARNFALSREE